ncbi:Uncharacterised protein [Neisseria gonorrhoeae]|nr:Uncharacterised protein [Neisseria gonorrhoeae]
MSRNERNGFHINAARTTIGTAFTVALGGFGNSYHSTAFAVENHTIEGFVHDFSYLIFIELLQTLDSLGILGQRFW